MNDTTPITKLPDGSAFFTATILSQEEAMALPPNKRPLNYRIPGDLYHAVFEAVGAASMCWDPRPDNCQFDGSAAEKVAVDLCFKIADELDKRLQIPSGPDPGESYRLLQAGETIRTGDEFCMGRDSWGPTSWAGRNVPEPEWATRFYRRKIDVDRPSGSA